MSDEEFNSFFDDLGLDDEPEFDDDDIGMDFSDDADIGMIDDNEALEDEFRSETDDDGGGISRTFMIVAGIIALAVVAIIILIVMVALAGSNELTGNQKTATEIAIYNKTQIAGNERTLTALAVIDAATETSLLNSQQTATAEVIAAQTRQANIAEQTATGAAILATQQAQAEALAAQQTATQQALDAAATAIAIEDRTLGSDRIRIINETTISLDNVRMRLYKDDGDGQFNPQDRLIAESEASPEEDSPAGPSAAAPSGVNTLAYGEVGESSLTVGQTDEWTFTGSAGDVVSISAEAAVPTQLDTFLDLFGPEGNRLVSNDDGGAIVPNALIESFELPANGTYTIAVSSIAGEGDYQLRLFLAIDVPAPGAPTLDDDTDDTGSEADEEDADSAYRPNTGGEDLGSGFMLVRQGGTPPPTGDELQGIEEILNESIDFSDLGPLEPGLYWLELEYDSLPAELQAQLPTDQPIIVQIRVPVEGPIEVVEVRISAQPVTPTPIPTETGTPTPLPSLTPEGADTATPGGDFVTLTPSQETEETLPALPTALPTTGFFGDINDGANNISGTSGLTVLAIAAAGLVAVVVIARKLRTST